MDKESGIGNYGERWADLVLRHSEGAHFLGVLYLVI